MDVKKKKKAIPEFSDGNEEHTIGNWRKGDSCYKVAKNLAELCVWKVELQLNLLLSKVLKEQPHYSWLLILKFEEINDLETEFLIKKEAELKDLEYS